MNTLWFLKTPSRWLLALQIDCTVPGILYKYMKLMARHRVGVPDN